MRIRVMGVIALVAIFAGCQELPTLVAIGGVANANRTLTPTTPTTSPNATGAILPPAYLSTDDGQLMRNGAPLKIHGVAWYGFETSSAMVQSNWSGGAMTGDFATIVRRMRLLGINAVRLPFSFAVLASTTRPSSLAHACTEASDGDLAASITPPGGQAPTTVPTLPNPPTHTPGQCNDYLPTDTVYNEFVWVAQFFARNGFYVLIDDHGRAENLAVTDPNTWLRDWKALVTQLTTDPNLAEQLMIGPVADVEALGLHWQATASQPGAGDLFLAAMDALHPIAPHALFYLGGTTQQGVYGDGFATSGLDPNSASDDATPFFQQLTQRAYARQVVLAPNAFGPEVLPVPGAATGAQLMAELTRSFGYLNRKGFCDGEACTRFAVSVWGFGSDFGSGDMPTMTDIASYIAATGDGDDEQHNAIQSWFYWCWNGNSSPAMGLLDSSWSTLQWDKIAYLQGVGLPQ